MKTRILYVLIFAAMFLTDTENIMAQETFYVYRKDKSVNEFFYDKVESIKLSKTDANSEEREKYVIQEIAMADSICRIPLAAIDSVGFQLPLEKVESELDEMRWEVLDLSSWWDDASVGGIAYQTGKLISNSVTSTMLSTPFIPCSRYAILYIPNMPVGTTLGTCFYDKDKVAIPYIEGMEINGNKAVGVVESVINPWMLVPEGACYFRTTKLATADNKIKAVRYKTVTDEVKPRTGNVLFGIEDFDGIKASGQSYAQDTEDYGVKQIEGRTYMQLNRFRYEVQVEAQGNGAKIGVGMSNFLNTTELVVTDNSVNVVYYVESKGVDERVNVITDVLPFSITDGGNYKLSIQRLDNSVETDMPKFGTVFRVEDTSKGLKWERVVKKNYGNASEYNGILSDSFTSPAGNAFVSIKSGTVKVYGIEIVDVDHADHAKVVMFGDSYSQGSTLIGMVRPNDSDNMVNRYSSLLEESIGHGLLVLTGQGGDYLKVDRLLAIKQFCRIYNPSYVFLQGSVNAEGKSAVPEIHIGLFKHAVDWLTSVGITPIISTIPSAVNNQSGRRNSFKEAFNEWVRNSGVRYVDFEKALLSAGPFPNDFYATDKVHPTAAGHAAIFEEFRKSVPELFE